LSDIAKLLPDIGAVGNKYDNDQQAEQDAFRSQQRNAFPDIPEVHEQWCGGQRDQPTPGRNRIKG
jgi:hypothetical protein